MRRENATTQTEVNSSHIQGQLEAYASVAKAISILQVELAERMGNLFLSSSGGQILGLEHRVPTLSGPSAKGSKASRKVEMAGNSYSDKPPRKKVKSWWHSLTAEQKKAIIAKRVKKTKEVWAKKKKTA